MLLKFEDMTTEQKLGMVFCARRFREDDVEFIIELIKKRALGCIQLPVTAPDIIKRILDAADYPILKFNDTERGFPTTELPLIPLMSLSACNNPEYFKSFAKGIVRDAKAAGYNGTWGPVIDVQRGDGPCKVGRDFSDDPKIVAERAAIMAKIYKDNGYLSTGKHYPGTSDFSFDTHMTEGCCSLSRDEIFEQNITPYIELMKKDLLPCIMTSHTIYKSLDPDYPASLSKKCIDIIRDLGFDGICFTDSLAMMGILQKYGEENAYGLAVAAGNDIVLPNYRTSVKAAYEMFVRQYEKGVITEERLNEATRRVLTAMEFVAAKADVTAEFTSEDEANLHAVARDSVTAVLDDGLSAKLGGKDEDKLFVIVKKGVSVDGIEQELNEKLGSWYKPCDIEEKIKEEFPKAGICTVPEYPQHTDNEKVLNEATKYKEVVFITYCDTNCYLGTDCMTRRIEALINCLIHSEKVSAVVHFGNPFALVPLLHVKRKLFGYKVTESQKYAIEVLSGKLEAKGKLPYNVDFR